MGEKKILTSEEIEKNVVVHIPFQLRENDVVLCSMYATGRRDVCAVTLTGKEQLPMRLIAVWKDVNGAVRSKFLMVSAREVMELQDVTVTHNKIRILYSNTNAGVAKTHTTHTIM
jgi:hypothetical protein